MQNVVRVVNKNLELKTCYCTLQSIVYDTYIWLLLLSKAFQQMLWHKHVMSMFTTKICYESQLSYVGRVACYLMIDYHVPSLWRKISNFNSNHSITLQEYDGVFMNLLLKGK
jgi:hypothetical protein